ncbi:MAG: hypothetical protein IAB19_10810, partial [Proteobacteria bacterium]|nr:hypothetical protein [Candidatus Avisuccinivibrio stercorigallinarum]
AAKGAEQAEREILEREYARYYARKKQRRFAREEPYPPEDAQAVPDPVPEADRYAEPPFVDPDEMYGIPDPGPQPDEALAAWQAQEEFCEQEGPQAGSAPEAYAQEASYGEYGDCSREDSSDEKSA